MPPEEQRAAANRPGPDRSMTAREWLDQFAARIGLEPPSDAEVDALLELAGVAAHASERIAAPLACWLVGRAGLEATEALRMAREGGGVS